MSTNIIKTAIIGASYVGKSTLCYAIADRPIYREYTSTIGVDYILKRVNKDISIGFWDLAGQERFATIITSYIQNSKQVVFCYNSESYESYTYMIDKYNFYNSHNYLDGKPIIVVATKIESKQAHPEYKKWSEDFVHQNKYPFVATSSYNKEGLENLIYVLAGEKQFESFYIENLNKSIPIILEKKSPKLKSYFRCCI
jgi:Ras-related protein Rab-6A